jgi:tRNA pseudouridine55 synthase
MKARDAALHGLLIVDKPTGLTSHDVVAQARRYFGTRRVGHAGTLDPLATGVLVLLLGEATKLSDVATNEDKAYLAGVSFGRATDSHDSQGQTTSEREVPETWLDESTLRAGLDVEQGRSLQVPPVVSAIKVGGQRSYRLARSGNAPALEARAVRVGTLTLLGWSARHADIELTVSKGYYVRAFARDLGETLGMPAHLSSLRRIKSGHFHVAEACVWPPPAPPTIIPLHEALPRLVPTWRLTPVGVERARTGKTLSAGDFADAPGLPDGTASGVTAWTDAAGTPVALGRRDGEVFRVQRGFAAETRPAVSEQIVDMSSI